MRIFLLFLGWVKFLGVNLKAPAAKDKERIVDMNLIDGLKKEIARCEKLVETYNQIPAGSLGARMIQGDIDTALAAMAAGDCDPTFEPMINMPDSDYEAEGFAYLNENKHLLPKSMPYDVSLAGFRDWQNDGSSLWVVRFEMVEII